MKLFSHLRILHPMVTSSEFGSQQSGRQRHQHTATPQVRVAVAAEVLPHVVEALSIVAAEELVVVVAIPNRQLSSSVVVEERVDEVLQRPSRVAVRTTHTPL